MARSKDVLQKETIDLLSDNLRAFQNLGSLTLGKLSLRLLEQVRDDVCDIISMVANLSVLRRFNVNEW